MSFHCILCLAQQGFNCPPLPEDFVVDDEHIREHLESVHDTPYPYSWESEDMAAEQFKRQHPQYNLASCKCIECFSKRQAQERYEERHRN